MRAHLHPCLSVNVCACRRNSERDGLAAVTGMRSPSDLAECDGKIREEWLSALDKIHQRLPISVKQNGSYLTQLLSFEVKGNSFQNLRRR